MSASANPAPGTAIALPGRKPLLVRLLASLVVAAVIVAVFILPAEFHRDPTRLGALMGLMQISEPPPEEKTADTALAATAEAKPGNAARTYGAPFRSDEIKIPLRGDEELEYKVRMQPGGTLVYSWSTNKGMVYYDFHGEPPDDPKKSQSYATGTADKMHGSLIAPFAGIHGWFLQNQEGEPIVVTVRMSGFYELREDPAGKK